MAVLQDRPKEPGEVKYRPPGGGPDKSATDLAGILRACFWDLMQARGWTTSTGKPNYSVAAREMGLATKTFSDFMDDTKPKSPTLNTLSIMCSAAGITPVQLFGMHEKYRPEITSPVDQAAYDSLRGVFDGQQAKRLYQIAAALRHRSALEPWLSSAESTLGIESHAPPPTSTTPVSITSRPIKRKKRR